jgi:predicted Rdx family selenoprotein
VGDRLRERFGAEVELVKSGGGVFEISRDGVLVFSKKKLDRFPIDDEIDRLGDT